jgi:hypothetical protein
VGQTVRVGAFDNRSVTSASDFPSAEYLKGCGVRAVVVVQESQKAEFDLELVLREWEAGGLNLACQHVGLIWDPRPLHLPTPSLLRKLWFWYQNAVAFHRNPGGGYGSFKHPSSS